MRGRLTASVGSSEGSDTLLTIAGSSAADHAVRFSWRPGDLNLWTIEDLTQIAAG